MLNRIFIIEPLKADMDVSEAGRYGEITYLFDPGDRRCSVFQHDKFGRTVLAKLRNAGFDPRVDCVCIVGAMLTLAVSVSAIAQSYDEFNLLLFNSVEGYYVMRRFKKTDWTTVKGDSNGENTTATAECD